MCFDLDKVVLLIAGCVAKTLSGQKNSVARGQILSTGQKAGKDFKERVS